MKIIDMLRTIVTIISLFFCHNVFSQDDNSDSQQSHKNLKCSCIDTTFNSPRFAPTLSSLIAETTINELNEIPVHTKGDFYKHIYHSGVWEGNSQSFWVRLTLITYAPILLEMDNASFAFNLTPCFTPDQKITEFQMQVSCSDCSENEANTSSRPIIDVTIETERIGILLDTTILHIWNDSTSTADIDESGNLIPPQADLLLNEPVEFRSNVNFFIEESGVCFPKSEISNTQVLLDFYSAMVDVDENVNLEVFYRSDYPMFVLYYDTVKVPQVIQTDFGPPFYTKDSIWVIEPIYDSLLLKFTGLYVEQGELYVPENSSFIPINAHDILINNYFISGRIFVQDIVDKSLSVSQVTEILQMKHFEILQTKDFAGLSVIYFRYKVSG